MKANNNHIDIRTIELYIQGKLSAKRKQAIDALRASDPFLDEALSGYEQVPGSIKGYGTLKMRYLKGGYLYWFGGFMVFIVLVTIGYWWYQPAATVSSLAVPETINIHTSPSDPTNLVVQEKVIQEKIIYPLKKEIIVHHEKKSSITSSKDSSDTLQVVESNDEIEKNPLTEYLPKEQKVEKKQDVQHPATQLDITVYYVYTREYILNTYIAMSGGSKNSYTKKGRDELDLLKSYLSKGELKKALSVLKKNNMLLKENMHAMNEWIDALELVEKKEYAAALTRLKNIDNNYPLRMLPTINKLVAELHGL